MSTVKVYRNTGITVLYPKRTVPHHHDTGIVCHIASQNQDSLHTSMLVERGFPCLVVFFLFYKCRLQNAQ